MTSETTLFTLFSLYRRQVNFEAMANADACALGPNGPSGPRMWHVRPIVEVVQRRDDGFGASEWTLHVIPINFLVPDWSMPGTSTCKCRQVRDIAWTASTPYLDGRGARFTAAFLFSDRVGVLNVRRP